MLVARESKVTHTILLCSSKQGDTLSDLPTLFASTEETWKAITGPKNPWQVTAELQDLRDTRSTKNRSPPAGANVFSAVAPLLCLPPMERTSSAKWHGRASFLLPIPQNNSEAQVPSRSWRNVVAIRSAGFARHRRSPSCSPNWLSATAARSLSVRTRTGYSRYEHGQHVVLATLAWVCPAAIAALYFEHADALLSQRAPHRVLKKCLPVRARVRGVTPFVRRVSRPTSKRWCAWPQRMWPVTVWPWKAQKENKRAQWTSPFESSSKALRENGPGRSASHGKARCQFLGVLPSRKNPSLATLLRQYYNLLVVVWLLQTVLWDGAEARLGHTEECPSCLWNSSAWARQPSWRPSRSEDSSQRRATATKLARQRVLRSSGFALGGSLLRGRRLVAAASLPQKHKERLHLAPQDRTW